MNTLINLQGMRFGKLLVLEKAEIQQEDVTRWVCQCDCGTVVYRLPEKLRNDVYSACDTCISGKAVAAMIQNAGYVECTQLKKLQAGNYRSQTRAEFVAYF